MKITKLKAAILFLFILLSLQSTFAQETKKKESKAVFGLGASLFNQDPSSPANSIYFIFNIGNKFRLEPSIGLAFAEDSKQYNPGIGIFGKKTISKFSILYGIRLNMAINKYTSRGYYYSSYYGEPTTVNEYTYGFSPTIGGEYSLIKNFSLGAEVKFTNNISDSDGKWTSFTSSSALIRFYF